MKRWIAALGVAAALFAVCGCAGTAAPAERVTPSAAPLAADAPLVAFYGDSYTLGTGASDMSKRWSTRICASRRWREFNPSRNGLGFVNHRDDGAADLPQQIIEADPDIVIVTMGLNDAFSFDRVGGGIRDRIRADFDHLSTALPDARIVVVAPFWYTAEPPRSLDVITGWVREGAERIGADYVAGATGWIQGRNGEMAADGLHPNDEGYDLLFRRMDEALGDLGL